VGACRGRSGTPCGAHSASARARRRTGSYLLAGELAAAERLTTVLAELAGLIAAGELELPIAATFPLDRVEDAYRRLEEGHVLGKIVLLP
jgi:NADPH:quinone reductase-like Zn-dependent oxidoreductase